MKIQTKDKIFDVALDLFSKKGDYFFMALIYLTLMPKLF